MKPAVPRSHRIAELAAHLLLLGAVLYLHNQFIILETAPPVEDGPARLIDAIDLWVRATQGRGLPESAYPPLLFGMTGGAFQIFGPSVDAALFSLAPFLALYVGSLGLAGRALSGPWGGLACAAVAAGGAWSTVLSRNYLLDLPSAATIALVLAALIWSRGLRRPGGVVLLALALTMGLLTRWTFVFFVGPPLALLALEAAWRDRGSRLPLGLLTLGLGLSVAALAWQSGALGDAWVDDPHAGFGPERPPPPPDFPAWLGWSLGGLWTVLLGAALWLRRDPGATDWRPGAGLLGASSVGALGAGWWYCLAAPSLVAKATAQRSDFVPEGVFWKHIGLQGAVVADAVWLAPVFVLLAVGLAWKQPALRRPFLWMLSGILVSVPVLVIAAPAAPRYVLGAAPMLVVLAIGGLGHLGRAAWGLVPVLGLGALVQAGWWLHPGLAPLVRTVDVEQNLMGIQRHLRLPAAAAPRGGDFPLSAAIIAAHDQGLQRLGVTKDPRAGGIEDRAFELMARLVGWQGQVRTLHPGEAPDGRTDGLIWILPAQQDPDAAGRSVPWLADWTRGDCWRTDSPDDLRAAVQWCLYTPAQPPMPSEANQAASSDPTEAPWVDPAPPPSPATVSPPTHRNDPPARP